MTASTHRTVLSLYIRVFRIARSWQAQSGIPSDTEIERKYILEEARTLFRQNQQVWAVALWWQEGGALQLGWLGSPFSSQLTEQDSIKKCIEECEARIEIGKYRQILLYVSPVKNTFSSNETDVLCFIEKSLTGVFFFIWASRRIRVCSLELN